MSCSNRKSRWAVSFAFFVNGIVFGGWVAHIPSVQRKFSMSEAELGGLFFAMGFGAVLVMSLTGWLNHRYGSWVLTIVATLAYAACLPVLFVVSSMHDLIIAMFLFGAANGSMDVAMNDQAIMVESRYKRPIMSSFHALFSVGGLVGAGVAVVLLSVGLGPLQQAYATSLLVFLLAMFLFPGLIKEVSNKSRVLDSQANDGRASLFNKSLALLAFLAFIIFMSEGAIADWGALYMRDYVDVDIAKSALAYTVFSLTMMLGRLTGDAFVQRFGSFAIVRAGAVLIIIGMTLVLLAYNFVSSLLGFTLLGAGLANLVPIVFSRAGNLPEIPPSLGIAAVSVCGYSGFLLGPPLLGLFAHSVGLAVALSLLLVFGFILLFCSRYFAR